MSQTSYDRQCRGKVPYLNLKTAEAEAKRMHKRMKAKFNAYVCPHCQQFHVGTNRTLRQAWKRGMQ